MEQQRNNQRTPCFKIQFPGDDTAKGIIQGKLQTVRGHLTKIRSNYVTNSDILNAVLDFGSKRMMNPYNNRPRRTSQVVRMKLIRICLLQQLSHCRILLT